MRAVAAILGVLIISKLSACQGLQPKQDAGGKNPAQPGPSQSGALGDLMTLKFQVPTINQFKTSRGDGSGIMTHYAYRLDALDQQCASSHLARVNPYLGPREEQISIPRSCRMQFRIAIGTGAAIAGQPFQPMFETTVPILIEPQIWLTGREASITYNLSRLPAGQNAGFVTTEVKIPAQTGAVPSQFPGPNPGVNSFTQPSPGLLPNSPATGSDSRIVEFRIRAGTGGGAWNDSTSAVRARVGQVVRIFNDDNVVHQLHTDGSPCPHGNPIRPGTSADCVISRPYSGQGLYDHNTRGAFHLIATQ